MLDPARAHGLFPPFEPYASGLLDVGDGHQIYFEQCGVPTGLPVVFLHGGPGSACSPRHRQLFDPAVFWVIFFDQRGCGRSTPVGELRHNTSDDLVADIEALRQHVGVTRWLVVGGSWGAGLGLAYAAAHTQACLGLLLRGVFLGRAADVDWFFNGARQFLPDAWAQLAGSARGTADAAHNGVLAGLDAALHSAQPGHALACALVWEAWEQSVSRHGHVPSRAQCVDEAEAKRLLAKYRLQSHYVSQGCFWGEVGLLQRTHHLGKLPVALVHGRQDWVCRPQAAWEVHAHLPQSRLRWVDSGGHNPFEPDMARALVQALAHFAAHANFLGWGQSFHPIELS